MYALPIVSIAELDVRPINWLGLHRDYLINGEMEVIAALLDGARSMLEFGCRDGRTARVLLHNVPSLERYVGVDVPMNYTPTLAHQRSEMVATPGHYAFDDPRFELLIRPRGSLDLGVDDLPPCDAAFIDGDHSEAAVSHDSQLARALIGPGGVIIWHDYGNGAVEVARVLDRLYVEHGWPLQHIEGTWLAVLRA